MLGLFLFVVASNLMQAMLLRKFFLPRFLAVVGYLLVDGFEALVYPYILLSALPVHFIGIFIERQQKSVRLFPISCHSSLSFHDINIEKLMKWHKSRKGNQIGTYHSCSYSVE